VHGEDFKDGRNHDGRDHGGRDAWGHGAMGPTHYSRAHTGENGEEVNKKDWEVEQQFVGLGHAKYLIIGELTEA